MNNNKYGKLPMKENYTAATKHVFYHFLFTFNESKLFLFIILIQII